MKYRLSAAYASITTAFFLGVAGCSSSSEGGPAPLLSGSTATSTDSTDFDAVARRWADLSGPERNLVCERASQAAEPDYRGMLKALMDTGLSEEDASAMLPLAVNKCI